MVYDNKMIDNSVELSDENKHMELTKTDLPLIASPTAASVDLGLPRYKPGRRFLARFVPRLPQPLKRADEGYFTGVILKRGSIKDIDLLNQCGIRVNEETVSLYYMVRMDQPILPPLVVTEIKDGLLDYLRKNEMIEEEFNDRQYLVLHVANMKNEPKKKTE